MSNSRTQQKQKTQGIQLRNEQRTSTDSFQEKEYEWPINRRKNAQYDELNMTSQRNKKAMMQPHEKCLLFKK